LDQHVSLNVLKANVTKKLFVYTKINTLIYLKNSPRTNSAILVQISHNFPPEIPVRISGEVPFEQYMVQARRVGSDGTVADDQRSGQFLRNRAWRRQGVRMMPCLHSDTITSPRCRARHTVEALWRPTDFVGDIQFM